MAPEAHALQEPFFFTFLLFYLFTFSRHARAHSQYRGDGRQNTNRCLNRELPNFLLIFHNSLVLNFTLIVFLGHTEITEITEI